jgi:hypothetical protein
VKTHPRRCRPGADHSFVRRVADNLIIVNRRAERRVARSPRGGRWQIVIMYCVCGSVRRLNSGITGDTLLSMAMTLRLADDETEALRRRAELEQRSMQEVARQAIREYVENHSRAELLDQVLDGELPRYAEALERLGQ